MIVWNMSSTLAYKPMSLVSIVFDGKGKFLLALKLNRPFVNAWSEPKAIAITGSVWSGES